MEGVRPVKSTYNSSTNVSADAMFAVDSDETSWSKKAFGDVRLIFAVLPPPIIVTGVVVNVLLLGLTAARRDSLRLHPVGVYVGGLCVCFTGMLVVDSGLQEWASFITNGPITARAQWLCRGVPFAVGWVRTSACWLTFCALMDRCMALAAALRTPRNDVVVDQATASTSRRNEPSTSAAEIGLVSATDGDGSVSKKTGAGGSAAVHRRPLLCHPVTVMLLTAGVFVAMAFANSPLLIRHWIRLQAQPAPRCMVPYHLVRLCTMTFYGTTAAPIIAALMLFVVLLVLVAVTRCHGEVHDADDLKIVLVMSSPVAVCLFVVELLHILCRYNLIDEMDGIVQELSDLVFYVVIAVVPALCFVIAPSLRVTRNPATTSALATLPAAADETITLSAID